MHRLAMALLITALPLAARADDAPKGDLAKLQGAWTAKVALPDGEVPLTIEFSGSKITLKGTHDGDEFDIKGEVRIDEKASPKTIDWVKLVNPDGDDIPERPSIYKLDGDTWIVCSNAPGAPRPTEIKKGADGPLLYITFRRKKDDDKKDEAKADDLARLQGDWKTMIGPNKDRLVTFSFKDKAVAIKFTTAAGETLDIKGEITLNESASPRTIDFVKVKVGDDGMDDSQGLYKVEGDTFTLCVAGPGEPRPAEFKAGEGDSPPHLWIFNRPK
jgi:uncharacterized protein (TIGR03067 family)